MSSDHDNTFFPIIHWFQQSPIKLSYADSLYVDVLEQWLKTISYAPPHKKRYQGILKDENFILFRQRGSGEERFKTPASPAKDLRPSIVFHDRTYFLSKIHLHRGTEHDTEGIPDHPDSSPKSFEIHLLHETFEPDFLAPKVAIAVYAVEDNSEGGHDNAGKIGASEARTKILRSTNIAGEVVLSICPADFLNWVSQKEEQTTGSLVTDFAADPRSKQFYHYEGSLTSPPYQETVSWIVFPHRIRMSPDSFWPIQAGAHQNERPTQEKHRRFVLRSFNAPIPQPVSPESPTKPASPAPVASSGTKAVKRATKIKGK